MKKKQVRLKENHLYSTEKEKFLNSVGLSEMAIEIESARDIVYIKNVKERERDIDNQIILSQIRESKYNKKYKEFVIDTRPKYLCNNDAFVRIDLIARARCGNFEAV